MLQITKFPCLGSSLQYNYQIKSNMKPAIMRPPAITDIFNQKAYESLHTEHTKTISKSSRRSDRKERPT